MQKKHIQDTYIQFQVYQGSSMFLALHNAEVIDIELDNNRILHMKIFDTVDYNSDEKLVEIPRKIQESGLLENYYIIINISVPIDNYIKTLEI